MERQVGKFKSEVVQEIWRSATSTFNIFYITNNTACIKGLRGTFSLEDRRQIQDYLVDNGISNLIYERVVGSGDFTTKKIKR